MNAKKTLQRTFVRDEAYILLRDWIVKGKLEPSQRLRDKDLAEQLGVSRTPIREALLRLEDEGFVQTKPNSSTVVAPIDMGNLCNMYSIVWTLEALALRQAFDSITNEAIDRMAKANEKLLKALTAGQPLAAVDADNDFHSVYIKLAHNEELEQILMGLKQKLKRVELYYFEKFKSGYQSYEEHQKIIKALKENDLDQSLKAIETNWKESFSRINPVKE